MVEIEDDPVTRIDPKEFCNVCSRLIRKASVASGVTLNGQRGGAMSCFDYCTDLRLYFKGVADAIGGFQVSRER